MNKKMKILPIVAMSTLFITGCTVTPEKQSTGNLWLDALNDLEVGDVKKKAADKIFKSNILASSDRNVWCIDANSNVGLNPYYIASSLGIRPVIVI